MVQGWQETIHWKEIYCNGTREKLLIENYSNQERRRRKEFIGIKLKFEKKTHKFSHNSLK